MTIEKLTPRELYDLGYRRGKNRGKVEFLQILVLKGQISVDAATYWLNKFEKDANVLESEMMNLLEKGEIQ